MGQDYGAGWGGPAQGEGKHGSDAGRPAGVTNGKRARLADLCAPHLEDVATVWAEIMNDVNAPHAARIAAAEKIADRVEGKAVATTITAAVDEFAELSDAELEARIERARRALAGGGSGASEAEGGE